MIKTYIKDLHNKSESHRKRVAYGTSAGITLVIALIWVTSFGYFNHLNPDQTTVATTDTSYKVAVAKKESNNNYLSNAYQAIRSAVGAKSTHDTAATGTLEYVPDEQ